MGRLHDGNGAEERLRASEERFRTVMEQSPLSMQIFAPDGRTLAVNPAWEHLFDASREEVIGYNILEDKQLEAAGVLSLIRKAFDGEAVRLPATYYDPARIGKNGRSRWLEGFIYPLVSGDGKSSEVALVHHDVTEHRLAQEELRKNEERLAVELAATQRLQEISTRMIHEGDAEALYEQILDAAAVIMGSDCASIQMLYPERGDGGELLLLRHRGFNSEAARFWERVRPDSESVCAAAWRTGERVVVPDIMKCDLLAGSDDQDVYLRNGIRAVQTTPLLSRSGVTLGMISTHWDCPYEPAPRDLSLLDVLARQAADLIERSHAEKALRDSEARYRTLFESIDEGFCIIEVLFDESETPIDYRFLETNPAFERQSGMQNVAGKRVRELIPAHLEERLSIYGRVALTGEPIRFEHRSDALQRWFEVYACRTGSPEDRKVALLFNNITVRKQAQQALEASRAESEKDRLRLQEIFSRAPAVIATLRGPNHTFESANPRYLQLVGERDILGRPVAEALPEVVEQGIIELLDGVYRTGESYAASEMSVLLDRSGGGSLDELFLHFVFQPLFEADGSVSGIFVHAVDVTEEVGARRKIEGLAQELEALNQGLEQRVEERTAELGRANAKLKEEIAERRRAERAVAKSNAALVKSNRELQDFAYVSSHDLQEPLRKISTFIDLLRLDFGEKLDENAHAYMDRLQDAAQRMSRLIRDLLAFSRVSTHDRTFEEVNLNEVVAEVLSDLEIAIAESGATVDVESLPSVEADPRQLHQLLQNLIGNAIKFHHPDSPPTVRISGTLEASVAGENGACHIVVEDGGIGFDERHLGRIFSPFQRLHGRSEYPGTGIGLAICRRIVERHGGTITATSTPGSGARFVVKLPTKRSDAAYSDVGSIDSDLLPGDPATLEGE